MTRLLLLAAAAALFLAPAALADSATSPSGLFSASTPPPVYTGVPATYTITMVNSGTTTLVGPITGVQLPASLTLKATSTECARTNKPLLPGTALSCNFPDIAPGTSASVSFTAVASSPGLYTIAVNGSALDDCFSPAPLCNGFLRDTLDLPVSVSPGPTDVQVTGSASTGSPSVGTPFTYTFQVKDNGPQAAYDVAFDDLLPAGLTPVGVSAGCEFAGNAVHCDLGLLGVGQQTNVVVTAIPSISGPITNFAAVSSSNPDSKSGNNTVGITVQPR